MLLSVADGGARAAAVAELEAADALRKEIGAHGYEPILDVRRASLARLEGDETARRA